MLHFEEKKGRFVLWILTRGGTRKEDKEGWVEL